MKKILITGSTGNMGRELSVKLANMGYMVLALCRKPNMDFGHPNIMTVAGDVTDADAIRNAVSDVDLVIHLAGIMPPMSENSPDKAAEINTQGTVNIVDAILNTGNKARLIFSSSVSVYGDTTECIPPVSVDSPQNPNTVYSKTKKAAEDYILNSGVSYTILRISAVFLAELSNPPLWPCTADQRTEFVYRDDVVTALLNSAVNDSTCNKILIIAGGESWRMKGREFVNNFLKIMEIPEEAAEYPDVPRYSDWYDTEEAQRLLNYQNTSYKEYLELLQAAVDTAFNW